MVETETIAVFVNIQQLFNMTLHKFVPSHIILQVCETLRRLSL